MYCNVILTRVRVAMVDVGKQWVLNILSVCLYSCLIYSAYQQHAPYYAICDLSDYTTFFQNYLTDGTIFGRRRLVIEHKMCFYFLYNFCPEHFSFREEFSDILS